MAKTHRFEALDAWRGICALLVAVEHLNTTSVLRDNAFTHHAYRFVDFFFVLSGFVIAHAYRDRISADRGVARSFLIRRIGRLWPLHVAMLLALVGVEVLIAVAARAGISLGHVAFTDKNTLEAIPANLLLIQGWGIFDRSTWNGPAWSISTEAFAYLVFAAMCAIVPARWIDAAASTLVLIALGLVLLVAPIAMDATFDYGLVRCIYGFMAGVLVRRAWGWRPLRLGTLGEAIMVAAVIAAVALLPATAPAVLVTPCFALTVWVFAGEDAALSRFLKRPWPQKLGAWSYSIYMVHVLIALSILTGCMLAAKHGIPLYARVDNIATIVGSAPVTAAITIGYLATVLVLASLTYRFIELPGQRLFLTTGPTAVASSSRISCAAAWRRSRRPRCAATRSRRDRAAPRSRSRRSSRARPPPRRSRRSPGPAAPS